MVDRIALSRSWLANLCRCDGKARRPRPDSCCITLREIPDKPDLAIYSQNEILSNGEDPTWDSPDITTNSWGPFRLLDEAKVVIRNLSSTAAAINALVHYYIAPFGIGMHKQLFATRRVNVFQGRELELLFPLSRDIQSGDPRVGVFVRIEHPHDANHINNYGAQVHDGSYTSEVGRHHSIQVPVKNNTAFDRSIILTVLPTDLNVTLTPTSHVFNPYEQIEATLDINVPGNISGSANSPVHRSVTVIGTLDSGELIGGVTKLLRIDT